MIFYLKTPLTWENTFLIQYLSEKFSNNLLYHFQEVDVKAIEEERAEDSLKVYNTVDGSSAFQVAVFTWNRETSKQLLVVASVTIVYPSMVLAKCLRHTASLHPTESQLPTVLVSNWVNRRHRGHQHWYDHCWNVLCNRCIFNISWHSLVCENCWGMCCSSWYWRWLWPQNFPRAAIHRWELFGNNKVN